jgi:hypothetical protein
MTIPAAIMLAAIIIAASSPIFSRSAERIRTNRNRARERDLLEPSRRFIQS